MQFRPETYSVALNFPPHGAFLSDWLPLKAEEPFVLLYPNSFSGCVLDKEESVALVSALSVAAGASAFPFPLFVPERDRQRHAYVGIQRMAGGLVSHMETDCVRSTVRAAAMFDVATVLGYYTDAVSAVEPPWRIQQVQQESTLSIAKKFDLSWTLPMDADSDVCLWIDDWNAQCPWFPWAEYEEPVQSVTVFLQWEHLPYGKVAVDMDALEACRETRLKNTFRLESLHRLGNLSGMEVEVALKDGVVSAATWQSLALDVRGEEGGRFFAQIISAFYGNFPVVAQARAIGEVASESFWDRFPEEDVPHVPTNSVLNGQVDSIMGRDLERESSKCTHPAVSESLVGYLALYALAYGDNPRAVALLWKRFVLEIRLNYWEKCELLPRMSSHAEIDHRCTLIEQKLQVVHHCILALRNTMHVAGLPNFGGNPELLTSDMIREYDEMFRVAGSQENRREVWKKFHGYAVRSMMASFVRDVKQGEGREARLDAFLAHFRKSRYFCKFFELTATLADRKLTALAIGEMWQARAAAGGPGGQGGKGGAGMQPGEASDDVRIVLCQKAEMALDWLEHADPSDLFSSLYQLGITAALNTMSRSRTVALKPMSDLLTRVTELARDWLMQPEGMDADQVRSLCLDVHFAEIAMAAAESMMQKLVFVPEGVVSRLLDDFISKTVKKEVLSDAVLRQHVTAEQALAGGPGPGGRWGGVSADVGEAQSNLLLLHLRRQQISVLHPGKHHSTFVAQDSDEGVVRFSESKTL